MEGNMMRILLVAEIEVIEEEHAVGEMGDKLDEVREATQLSHEHGITLYKATKKDLEAFAGQGALFPEPMPIHL